MTPAEGEEPFGKPYASRNALVKGITSTKGRIGNFGRALLKATR